MKKKRQKPYFNSSPKYPHLREYALLFSTGLFVLQPTVISAQTSQESIVVPTSGVPRSPSFTERIPELNELTVYINDRGYATFSVLIRFNSENEGLGERKEAVTAAIFEALGLASCETIQNEETHNRVFEAITAILMTNEISVEINISSCEEIHTTRGVIHRVDFD